MPEKLVRDRLKQGAKSLGVTPTHVDVSRLSNVPAISHYTNITDTSFDVVFESAPAGGTENIELSYEVSE
jgi:hypothetical protein